jgi:hypothetical protein
MCIYDFVMRMLRCRRKRKATVDEGGLNESIFEGRFICVKKFEEMSGVSRPYVEGEASRHLPRMPLPSR